MSEFSLYGNQAKGIEGIFIHSKLDDAGLSLEAFRVFSHLARRASRAGKQAYPGVASIARVCGISENTVRKAIRELTARQMIVVQQGGGTATNRYLLTSFDRWTGNFEILDAQEAPLHGLNPSTECTPPLHGLNPPPSRFEPKGTQDKVRKQDAQKEEGALLAPPELFDSSKPESEPLTAPQVLPDFPAATMVRIWNECVPGAKIQALAGQRKTLAGARWKQLGSSIAEWTLFCQRVGNSPFLTGQESSRSKRTFTATFDWCILPGNFLKIQENRYPPKSESKPKAEKPYDW